MLLEAATQHPSAALTSHCLPASGAIFSHLHPVRQSRVGTVSRIEKERDRSISRFSQNRAVFSGDVMLFSEIATQLAAMMLQLGSARSIGDVWVILETFLRKPLVNMLMPCQHGVCSHVFKIPLHPLRVVAVVVAGVRRVMKVSDLPGFGGLADRAFVPVILNRADCRAIRFESRRAASQFTVPLVSQRVFAVYSKQVNRRRLIVASLPSQVVIPLIRLSPAAVGWQARKKL